MIGWIVLGVVLAWIVYRVVRPRPHCSVCGCEKSWTPMHTKPECFYTQEPWEWV